MRAEVRPWSAARVGSAPTRVVARLTARKALRSGALWGYFYGLTVASSALGYASAYPSVADRETFAATFGTNAGLSAITGPAVNLASVAGYTAWKSLAFLSVLGGVWGLLVATRLLRGEEDAGRWELLLAGQTTRRGATAQALAGLGGGVVTLFFVAAVIDVAVGHTSRVHIAPGAMLFFTVAAVSGALMFLGIGALASQLAATRRQAAGYAGAVLGASYALRMVADSGTGLTWLRWASPLGWVEELQPLTSPRPLALVPIGVLCAAVMGLSVRLAATRDLGTSVLPDRPRAAPRTALLSGPTALTVRLTRSVLLAWAFSVAAAALLLGFVAKQAGSAFSATPSIAKVFNKLGAHGTGARSYLGVSFLMIALLVAFVAIGQVSALRAEEANGYLEHFLVRPLSRRRWLGGRVVFAVSVVVANGLLAGVFVWVGALSANTGIGLGTLLGAGLNVVPPALVLVGAGVLAMGIWPRATAVVSYGLLAWSLLIEIVGGAINVDHWILDTSIFHQIAAAPAVGPNWVSACGLLGAAVAATLVGALAFDRRDLAGE